MVSGTPTYEVLSVGFNAGATRLAVGGTDSVVYIFAVDKPAAGANRPHSLFPKIRLLAELRGHSDTIVQVLFSRSGDSIVTAGREGIARIWRRTKAKLPIGKKTKGSVSGMGSWSSIVLDCRRQNGDFRSGFSGGHSGSACGSIVAIRRRSFVPIFLCAVVWSHDDKYVITSSSDAKIRIWYSDTGQLARLLDAHEQEVYVMDFHPLNGNILLTAGYDGKCILWDVESGEQLQSFIVGEDAIINHDPSQGPPLKGPSICDGQFAHDGMSFVVSDTSGAITVFGVSSGDATALAPEEQFFSDEHSPFRRDPQQRVVDEATGQLLHLVRKGPICNRHFRPHPPELQPNVADSSQILDDTEFKTNEAMPSSESGQQTNYNTLVAKANEFRRNQEKEEKKLLREARAARRRQNIDREKAELQRDTEPNFLALRDFEVPDSGVEDSDEEYVARDSLLNKSDSSSSSSSSSEDAIQPVRKGGSSQSHAKKLKMQDLSGMLGKRGRPRKAQERAKRRRLQVDLTESGDDDVKKKKDEEESPAYEAGSQDSDSDDSKSSVERSLFASAPREEKSTATTSRKAENNTPSIQIASKMVDTISPAESEAPMSALPSSPSRSNAQVTASLTLAGASIVQGKKRMKISKALCGRENQAEATDSTLTTRQATGVKSERSRYGIGTEGAASSGHPTRSEAAACTGVAASHNPSHTTERQDGSEPVRRSSAHIEEQEEDAASCFRSRNPTDAMSGDQLVGTIGEGFRHHSSTHGSFSAERDKIVPVPSQGRSKTGESLNGMTNGHSSQDVIEKSVLSDSPGTLTRKRWRARTRSGSAIDGTMENATAAFIGIDAIADRELELLNAQSIRKRKRGKPRSFTLESDREQSSDDGIEAKAEPIVLEEGQRLGRRRSDKGAGGNVGRERSGEGSSRSLEASSWLRSSCNRYTYVPQLGDEVMYFPEGHLAAIDIARNAGLEPLLVKASYKALAKEVLDATTLGKDCPPLSFEIIDVTYQFPTASQKVRAVGAKGKGGRAGVDDIMARAKTVTLLTLKLISGMKRRAGQEDRFVLSYFPVDAPEYLVLSSRVEAAMMRQWKQKDRFRILFLNEKRAWEYFTGRIRSVKSIMPKVMWNTVEVEYDNEGEIENNTDFVSPWELESFDLIQGSRDAGSVGVQVLSNGKQRVAPGVFPMIARELDAIQAMEASWRAQVSWMDTVDTLAAVPGYCEVVPCPIDLNIILVRLCTGYYRHVPSFFHDILLLKNNAIRFHGEQSEIGLLTVNVCNRILEMAERIHADFVPVMAPVGHGLAYGVQTSSRGPWMRQSAMDLGGGGMAGTSQVGNGVSGRPFGVAMTTARPGASSLSAALSTAGTAMHDGSMVGQHRALSGMRMYSGSHNGNQGGGMRTLPPTRPVGASGASTRSARGGRGAGRAKNVRQQHGNGGLNRGSSGGTGFRRTQAQGSPTMSVSGAMATGGGVGSAGGSVLAHRSQESIVQIQGVVTGGGSTGVMATNSAQVGSSHSGDGALQQNSRTGGAISKQHGSGAMSGLVSAASLPPFSDMVGTYAGRGYNGVASPPPDGIAMHGGSGGGTVSVTHPSRRGDGSMNGGSVNGGTGMTEGGGSGGGSGGGGGNGSGGSGGGRGGGVSGAGGGGGGVDGGTHSWSRSMEGAGGILPLQASTSESHVVVMRHGRSHGGISPSGGGGMNGSNGGVAHEHSTVSMAAAESTMSCGGAEVALQAASAESVEVATNCRTPSGCS